MSGSGLIEVNTDRFTSCSSTSTVPRRCSVHPSRDRSGVRATAGACRSLLIPRSRRDAGARAPAGFFVKTCRSLLIPKTRAGGGTNERRNADAKTNDAAEQNLIVNNNENTIAASTALIRSKAQSD